MDLQPVKALVLTFDRYRCFTDHMIHCYQKLWPGHPFIFHIPCQAITESTAHRNVRYIQSQPGIKDTLKSLLSGLDDEEMIYWCIDDKYPIKLDIKRIAEIHDQLLSGRLDSASGVLFCRCRGMFNDRNLTGSLINDSRGNILLERSNYSQIWIHQYVKVKVLRVLFDTFPDDIPTAKAMDALKSKAVKPASHRLFVTRKNLATFGESTSRGAITLNCLNSMKDQKLDIPPWVAKSSMQKKIIMGGRNRELSRSLLKGFAKFIFGKH